MVACAAAWSEDEAGVVAGGVGGPERFTVGQHSHIGAEDGVGAVEAIDDDVGFAVVVSLGAAGEFVQFD